MGDRMMGALARLQRRRPGLVLLFAIVLLALAIVPARRIELRTELTSLLAPDHPSMRELDRVLHEVGIASKVYVVVESDVPGGARACADQLAGHVRAVGAPITSAETGMQRSRAFLRSRALFFAKIEDLERVRTAVRAHKDRAVVGALVGDLDKEGDADVIDVSALRRTMTTAQSWADRFPDGYYESQDGKGVVLLVTTSVAPGDLAASERALSTIQRVVRDGLANEPTCRASSRVGYAGDLVTAYEGYRVVRDDLRSVGVLGIAGILAVVMLFFFRVRALVGMALSLALGLAWTFGIAEIAIGHLNVATGFMVSIVAGNGLNVGIILAARTFEELRAPKEGQHTAADPIVIATTTTWRATLGAALASAAAYGSLAVTGFKAFVELAFIGAVGMLACWVATYLVLPPLLVLCERVFPFVRRARDEGGGWLTRLRAHGVPFGVPIASFATRAPRLVALVSVLLVLAGVVLGIAHARRGLIDPDLRRIRSDLITDPAQARVVARASEILGSAVDSPTLVLASSSEQVEPIRRALEEQRGGSAAYGEVHAMSDFIIPTSDYEQKLPIVRELRRDLVLARKAHGISDEDWAVLAPLLPESSSTLSDKPFTIDDLPDLLPAASRSVCARLLVIEPPPPSKPNSNANYNYEYDLPAITALAGALTEIRLGDGTVVRGTGRAVVFAGMLREIFGGLPRALVVSLIATALAIVFVVRRVRLVLLVLGSLFIGLAALALVMNLASIRLNLFSVVALPIMFGIGADYAINLVQRAASTSMLTALRDVGGAVLLCSATTTIGYLALVGSVNPAIRSLGALSVLGEVSCVAATLVALPAIVIATARSRK